MLGELKPKGPKGFAADPDYWKGEVFAYVGLPQYLKDLKACRALLRIPTTGRAKCLSMLGEIKT